MALEKYQKQTISQEQTIVKVEVYIFIPNSAKVEINKCEAHF